MFVMCFYIKNNKIRGGNGITLTWRWLFPWIRYYVPDMAFVRSARQWSQSMNEKNRCVYWLKTYGSSISGPERQQHYSCIFSGLTHHVFGSTQLTDLIWWIQCMWRWPHNNHNGPQDRNELKACRSWRLRLTETLVCASQYGISNYYHWYWKRFGTSLS